MPGQCHCVWGSGLFSLMYTSSYLNGGMYVYIYIYICIYGYAYICVFVHICVISFLFVCLHFFCFLMLQLYMYVYAHLYVSACSVCTCVHFSKCTCGMFRSRVFVGVYISPTIWLSHLLVIQMHSVYLFCLLWYEELHAATLIVILKCTYPLSDMTARRVTVDFKALHVHVLVLRTVTLVTI